MGITEILTIIFVVMKLMGKIDWSWWLVALPEIIAAALYLLLYIIAARQTNRAFRKIDRSFKDLDDRW